MTIGWKGQVSDGSGNSLATPQGRIVLPYISDENHDEVPEMRFSGEADDTATQRIREAFLSQGKKVSEHRTTNTTTVPSPYLPVPAVRCHQFCPV